jgi:GT2 family glycosyltransferase
MEEGPDVGFVFNQYRAFDTGNVDQLPVPARHFDGKWLLDNYFFSSWTSVVRGTAMIRREAWDQVGGMREQFGLVADIDLWIRLSRAGSVGYVEDPLITVRQQRPDYYPEIYKSTHWSWHRQRLVYEIHAANRKEYYGRGFRASLRWAAFRMALSLETTKWLCYSVVTGRQDMIRTSDESVTPYDLFPLRILRWIIRRSIPSDYRLSA